MPITDDSTLEDLYQTGKINVRIYNGLCRYFRMAYPDRFDWYNAGTQITINDICKLAHHQLLGIRNLGVASVTSLCEALAFYGFRISGYTKLEISNSITPITPLPVTYAWFKEEMLKLKARYDKDHDEETFHSDADDLMRDILKKLGYVEGIEIYDSVHKYYS